jgi:hypothetical protein
VLWGIEPDQGTSALGHATRYLIEFRNCVGITKRKGGFADAEARIYEETAPQGVGGDKPAELPVRKL